MASSPRSASVSSSFGVDGVDVSAGCNDFNRANVASSSTHPADSNASLASAFEKPIVINLASIARCNNNTYGSSTGASLTAAELTSVVPLTSSDVFDGPCAFDASLRRTNASGISSFGTRKHNQSNTIPKRSIVCVFVSPTSGLARIASSVHASSNPCSNTLLRNRSSRSRFARATRSCSSLSVSAFAAFAATNDPCRSWALISSKTVAAVFALVAFASRVNPAARPRTIGAAKFARINRSRAISTSDFSPTSSTSPSPRARSSSSRRLPSIACAASAARSVMCKISTSEASPAPFPARLAPGTMPNPSTPYSRPSSVLGARASSRATSSGRWTQSPSSSLSAPSTRTRTLRTSIEPPPTRGRVSGSAGRRRIVTDRASPRTVAG